MLNNKILIHKSHLYDKCPKILKTLFHTILSLFMQLFLEILSGMANSVDPDQTAPSVAVWSGSPLSACVIMSATLVYKTIGHLLYYNIFVKKFPWNCLILDN